MAFKLVSNLKDSIQGILTGINLNNVQNLNGALERTARELATRISLPDALLHSSITLYDGVTDYTAPTTIFDSGLVDIQPQGKSRSNLDFVYKEPLAQFDRNKSLIRNGYHVTMDSVNGVGRLRIASVVPIPKIELDSMTAITGWTGGGSASGLTVDSTVYWQVPSSFRFTLTGASTGTLTKTIDTQDLTNYTGVGVAFLAIRTPSASNLTSLSIKLGSSSGNYYQVSTVTTGFLGAWTANDWLLVAFDLANATTVGSPTVTSISFCQISIVHAATIVNFYVGDLWISLPSPHTLIFQSAALFQISGGSASQTITNNSDSVLLNDAALVIYEYECAQTIAQQQGGTLANGLIATINEKLNGRRARNGMIVELGLYDIYRGNNPSQELRLVGSYYED